MNKTKEVLVIGMGYVGSSMASVLSVHNNVTCVDIDKKKIESINIGESPLSEKGMREFWKKNCLNIVGVNKIPDNIEKYDFIVLSLPTNFVEEINSFETDLIEKTIKFIIKNTKKTIVIIKSTVPIGFTSALSKKINTERVLFSPEFLREGTSLEDNLNPSRIVVGGNKKYASKFAELLMEACENKETDVQITAPKEAEAIKLFANSYLAMRVGFFNEVDNFSIEHKLDTEKIIRGISTDPRVGNFYNNPSFGYGGYCLPKDSKQLLSNFKKIPQALISAIVASNQARSSYLAGDILKKDPKTIGMFRLSMKTGSDNFRSSSSMMLLEQLKKYEVEIIIYEPMISASNYKDFRVVNDFQKFGEYSDLILANRQDKCLKEFADKLYCRDIFEEN